MSVRKNSLRKNNSDQGSPQPGEPVFILIGKIRRPHGVDGEMMIDPYSESVDRFKPGNKVLIGEDHLPQVIRTRRAMDRAMLITFKDISDPDQAGLFRNKFMYILKDDLPELPDGEYYHFDLVGLNVFDTEDELLGVLTEVLETGANDVYVVKSENGEEILLPAIESVIISVNLKDARMVVKPPEWN
jgi:16S rRNA processing protein RimM